MWQRLLGGGGGGSDDDSGSSSSSSSSSSNDSSTDSGGGGGFWGGVSDAVGDAADTVTDTVDDTVDSVTGGGSSSRDSSSRSRSSGSSSPSYGDFRQAESTTYDSGSSSSSGSSSGSSSSSSGGGGGGGGFFGGVSDTIDDATDAARDTANDVARDVDRTVDRAEDTANDVARDVDHTVDNARDTANDVARDIDRTVDRTVNDVSSGAQNAADDARNAAESAARGAQRAVDQTVDQVQDTVGNTVDDATAAASNAADDAAGAADHFAGSTDEAVGRAVKDAQQGDVAGVADHLAGSTDEFVNKQAEAAATGVTPHAGMSLGDDEEGWEARAKKERVMAERAEQGWEDVTSGDLPSVAEGGAMLFQGSEVTERLFTGTAHQIEEGSPTADMGPKIGNEHLGDVPGNVVGGLVGGVGMIPGAVGQLGPSAAADLTDPETQTDGQSPSEVVGTGDMAVNVAESQWRMLEERPVSTGILLAAPAAEAVPKGIKGYRAGRGRTIPYESITDASGARGGVSRFETSTDAPTSRAVSEVRSRAANQPDVVKEAAGSDSVLYHTTGQKLGKNLDVGEGASELPGLWTAPDANSVGLRSTDFGSSVRSWGESLKPRKPDLSTSPDRVAAFEGESIRGMPEWAQGAGYEVRAADGSVIKRGLGRGQAKKLAEETGDGATVAPDQTTGGYKFLDEAAQDGSAYVRPTGSRTPELEAIYGPGTKFTQRTAGPDVNVRVGGKEIDIPFTDRSFTYGGEKLPMDFYRRAGEAPDETGGLAESAGRGAGETSTAGDIASSYRSLSELGERPSGTPFQNYGTAFGASGGASSATDTGQPSASGPTMPFDELGPMSPSSPSGGAGSPESPYSFLDETGGMSSGPFGSGGSTPTSTSDGPSPGGSSSPPSSGPRDLGPEWSSGGLFDESGPTSSPESPPTSSGPTTPFDEYGPMSPPSSDGPSSPPRSPPTSSGPSSPPRSPPSSTGPSSPPSGPPSSPPGWPPSGSSWSGSEPGRSPPGSSPSESPTGFGPSPFDPEPQRRRRGDDDRRKDEEEFRYPEYGTYYTPFENPIASGAEVLFGGLGGGMIDEAGGLQDAGGGAPESTQGGMIDETGGFGAFGGPIDETGGLDDWTPF